MIWHPVGAVVKRAPTLVDAFNDHIPENGDGSVDIPIAVKAASSGRVKLSNIDITYAMQTRAVGASFEGGLAASGRVCDGELHHPRRTRR